MRDSGEIEWRRRLVIVGELLAGGPVGIEAIDNDLWIVGYGPAELDRLGPRAKPQPPG